MSCTDNTHTLAELVTHLFCYSSGLLLQVFPVYLFSDLLIRDVGNDGTVVRMERGKKLLRKQSCTSESDTNNASASELCFVHLFLQS